jgi:hypothetical protein
VDPFVGSWNQHAGNLTIHANGTITLTYQSYSTTSDGTPTFPDLTLHITSTTSTTATAIVDTSDDPTTQVGAHLTLRLASPGIILTPLGQDNANDTWCDATNFSQGGCGA